MTQPAPARSYREAHLAKGADYHAVFRDNPRRALLWRLEQELLERILARFLAGRPIDHLDFACGTGRILAFLEGRTRSSTGVDVSASMLAAARGHVGSTLVEGDLTRGDLLPERRFDLITAFRFFPNAEPELRRDAMAALAARLAPGGVLVFNNHINRASLLRRLVRLARGAEATRDCMAPGEAEELVAGAELRVLARYHAGIVPETEQRLLRPRALVAAVERAATHLPLAGLSDDVLYVCGPAAGGGG
jgi:SAM-dependent methyltransferase